MLIDVLILIGWIAITVASPLIGMITAIPALVLAVVPEIVAYLAIHLRYDTTWYVVSERSLRTRRFPSSQPVPKIRWRGVRSGK